MSQPPEEVPEGLSAHEYQRLIALYTLMGRHNHAAKAFSRLSENDQKLQAAGLRESILDAPEVDDELLDVASQFEGTVENLAIDHAELMPKEEGENKLTGTHDQFILGHQAGTNFAEALLKLLQQLTVEAIEKNDKQQPVGESKEKEDPLKAMKEQLLSIGLSEKEAQEYVQKLRKALADMTHSEPPPRELPEELSAEEYWQLAVRYKQVGWTEQARDALNAAMEIDGDGPVGIKARSFLRSKIPRYPVPLMAEQLNIQGYNQMFVNEHEAQKTFEHLVKEYPDFEWPYGNLGSLLIKRGDLISAQELLVKAVQINPYYINGWLHLSRVYAIQEDFAAAEDCLQRVTAIDASDPNWRGISDLVQQLKTDFGA